MLPEQKICSFKAAVLFFYESALGAKGSENDRKRSWRWRERLRAFRQQRCVTELVTGLVKIYQLFRYLAERNFCDLFQPRVIVTFNLLTPKTDRFTFCWPLVLIYIKTALLVFKISCSQVCWQLNDGMDRQMEARTKYKNVVSCPSSLAQA